MKMLRWLTLLVFLLLPALHVTAQDDAPPVLILPVDGAHFLPGVRFDFRDEVHTDALPADFAVTVNTATRLLSRAIGLDPSAEDGVTR